MPHIFERVGSQTFTGRSDSDGLTHAQIQQLTTAILFLEVFGSPCVSFAPRASPRSFLTVTRHVDNISTAIQAA